MFLWQACNNILPTKENLWKRKITNDPLCPVCHSEVETVGHALWSCTATRDVWLECTERIQKSCSKEDAFCNILQKLFDRLEVEDCGKVACIARQVWLRRNKMIFEGVFTYLRKVFQTATDQLEFYLQVSQDVNCKGREKHPPANERWKTPPKGIMKLNWDAAIDRNKKLMGIGIVVRDFTGEVVATQCTTKAYVCNPVVAEAMALWTAVVLLGQLSFMDVILEGDCLEVVKAIQMETRNETRYGFTLEEAKEMLKGCRLWEISHVRRTANEVAHRVAKMAVSLHVNNLWLTTTPPCIRDIVLAERACFLLMKF
jgi:ribonuclease HI